MRRKFTNDSTATIWPIQHLFCAAYLLTQGYKISRIEHCDGAKSVIYFEGDDIQNEATAFFNGVAQKVDPKKYASAYRDVKDWLFGNKS